MEYCGQLYGRVGGRRYFELGITSDDYDLLQKRLGRLKSENAMLLGALSEISDGKGRYNEDRLQHACNTIEDMINLAKDAIKESEKLHGFA